MKSINGILFIRIFAFFLIAAGCFYLSNCHLGPEGDAILFADGHVYDIASGEPLEGAWVNFRDTILSPLAVTDSSGHFEIIPLVAPPQFVRIFFGMEGYTTRDTVFYISVKDLRVDSLEIYLESD